MLDHGQIGASPRLALVWSVLVMMMIMLMMMVVWMIIDYHLTFIFIFIFVGFAIVLHSNHHIMRMCSILYRASR